MPSIPVTTPLGYIGVFFVIAGFFLVIAGIELIKIEKLTITPGRKTWGIGLLLATIGVLFLLPDILSAITPSPAAVDTVSPNLTSSPSINTSIPTSIVQSTSLQNIPSNEAATSMPLTMAVPTFTSQAVACVTSRTGSGAPAEV